jgi:chemotaxis protein MotB
MARRKHHEEHANHEAWAIPYADLMTLLLAFFVVMYAISSVNEGKYRIMADALTDAFGGAPRTINPVQVGNKQVQGGGWDSPSVIKSGTKIGPSAPAPSHDPTCCRRWPRRCACRCRCTTRNRSRVPSASSTASPTA